MLTTISTRKLYLTIYFSLFIATLASSSVLGTNDTEITSTQENSTSDCGCTDKITSFLKDNSLDIFSHIEGGRAPLCLAVGRNNWHILKTLRRNNADINVQDINGRTLLYSAIEESRLNIIKTLLQHNADVNIQDKYGETPLHLAIEKRNINMVMMLLKRNANVNIEDGYGETPLHSATKKKSEVIVMALLEHDAEVNVQDVYGWTALHWATEENNLNITKLLLQYNADVNIRDMNDWTPIFSAIRRNGKYVIEKLLQYNADINIQEKNGLTPLDYAIIKECDCINVLKQQIIKLKVAELYVRKSLVDLVYNLTNEKGSTWIDSFEDDCKQELSVMKKRKPSNTNVSFYDLLVKDLTGKVNITDDEDIIRALNSNKLRNKFPLYAGILQSRFQEAQEKNE